MKYKASNDLAVKIATTFIFTLFITIAFYSGYEIIKTSGDLFSIISFLIVIILQFLILVLCYIYSPQFYLLNDESLTIKRIAKDRILLLRDFSEIRLLDTNEVRGIIRTFGVGGLFGYFGKYSSRKLGKMTWYTTQNKNRVLIILKTGEKIVITPDDILVIDVIQSKINH